MKSSKTSILVVDDDIRIVRMIKRLLELEEYEVVCASCGEEAIEAFEDYNPALVLLDIMMPDISGYTVCERIREFSQVPIIMVTAKGNEDEKVLGFDAGADDYITKPFSSRELVARVRAVLRRVSIWEETPGPRFELDGLSIDFARHTVAVQGSDIKLTATEYKLVAYLALNAGKVLTPEQLLTAVWGEEYSCENHLLQVNIARLRNKLSDDARNPRYILTKSGIGYMMKRKDHQDIRTES